MKSVSFLWVVATLFAASAAAQSSCSSVDEVGAEFNPSLTYQWAGWGGHSSNTRYYMTGEDDLTGAHIPELELKWAFGFPNVRSVLGQPAIAGERVFIGVDTGEVYSLDANSGCVYWTFQADSGVRTAPVVENIDREWTVYFGDLGAQIYALDAKTGELRWKAEVDEHPSARITGTPQLYRIPRASVDRPARLFVPVSSGEEGAGGGPGYECCTFRGSVVALDAITGDQIWKTYTIQDEPQQTSAGKFGPSGGAIWSAPTIDIQRGALYVATGDAYSAPADEATDAIIAMNLDDGKIRWIAQETADDIWVAACMRPGAEECGPDHDFGSPAMLVTREDGSTILVAGQKSGNVWAHDPVTGEVLWRTPLVDDTTAFGGKIIWGGAADESKAYFGLGPGGIGAVQLEDGELQWFTDLTPSPDMAAHPGQDGPITAVEGAIFSGGWDGVLRALSSSTGEVIWEYNTARDFDTVNGVEAKGGSMGAAGPVVAQGKLFVPSGYLGVKNGMPGNVLLMFAPGE